MADEVVANYLCHIESELLSLYVYVCVRPPKYWKLQADSKSWKISMMSLVD